jgi:ubiquinol-cytochrome c reductase iron-sulfur subunit
MNNQRVSEAAVVAGFLLAAGAGAGVAAVYWTSDQPQLEGALLALAFAGLAYGFVVWGKRLLPQGPFVEDRPAMSSSEASREAFEDDFTREGTWDRRSVIVRALGLALGALGVAVMSPLRSLGPNPDHILDHTPWRPGTRLVTPDGTPVTAGSVPLDGLVTVFPEGFTDSESGQVVLIRVAPSLLGLAPGPPEWMPDGFIAFSKVCTHAGCPVGLYQAGTHQLLCPCHQSSFDVLKGGKVVFGPAGGPLPQLPLMVDARGFLRARGDFPTPVGPVFWRHS